MTARDTIVVGAGLSGLRAATRLAEAGQDVLVLEARDRVGGRTLTREFDGARLDLGGQWMGPGQDRLAQLAKTLGLRTFPTAITGTKLLERAGGLSRYKGSIPSLPLLQLPSLHFMLRRTDRAMMKVPLDDPTRAPDARALDADTLEAWKQRHIRGAAVRDSLDCFVRAVFGAEPVELSMLYFLFYLRSGGGLLSLAEADGGAQQTRFVDGAQSFSERLAEQLPEPVRLAHPVIAVEHGQDTLSVHTAQGSFKARRLIVAIPPALVDRVQFTPGLPATRVGLQRRMPMGAAIKCLVFYDRPFWREAGLSGELVSSTGPVTFTYDNSGLAGPPWNLVAFIVGDAARRWSDHPDARRRAVVDHLVRTYGPAAANPTRYVDQDWCGEPWSGGCPVSLMGPGVWTGFGQSLREPVGRIHWAGTETATAWCGYLEGALQAGERAAREVLES